MYFNIDNYKGEYVMHCKTVEEAESFCNYLSEHGKKWCDGTGYKIISEWYHYDKDTIYYFNEGSYGHIDYVSENYTILEWEDFMKHTFTKADLKTGDVILKRNGDVEIVIKEHNVLLRPRECNRLADLNDDLTHSFLRDGDVIAVRRPNTPIDCQFGAFKDKRGTLVYERHEVEEMTLEQVCKLLGKEIKIIK